MGEKVLMKAGESSRGIKNQREMPTVEVGSGDFLPGRFRRALFFQAQCKRWLFAERHILLGKSFKQKSISLSGICHRACVDRQAKFCSGYCLVESSAPSSVLGRSAYL